MSQTCGTCRLPLRPVLPHRCRYSSYASVVKDLLLSRLFRHIQTHLHAVVLVCLDDVSSMLHCKPGFLGPILLFFLVPLLFALFLFPCLAPPPASFL